MIAPPSDIAPERLWRMLIQRQRASMPLKFRVRGAEHFALCAVALTGLEAADALAESDDVDLSIAGTVRVSGVIAAVVHCNGKRAFRSVEQVGLLSETEASQLGIEVYAAISTISPIIQLIDAPKWKQRLANGARHRSNMATAARVASCVTPIAGFKDVVREAHPDKWFGLPVCELTDGQLLAFDAARAAFERDK